ncbi:hypothetical protein D0868_12641, partial [Hortaea werneckii]
DALQRHEITHNSQPSLLQQGARACSNCAAAKSRCSGHALCSRCKTKGLVCTYPISHSPNGSRTSTSQPPVDLNALANQETTLDDIFDPKFWESTNVLENTNWLAALGDDYFDFDTGMSAQGPVTPWCSTAIPENLPPTPKGPLFATPTSGCLPQAALEDHQNGEFYVDGQPTRLPHVKRRRTTSTAPIFAAEKQHSGFSLAWRPVNAEKTADLISIRREKFEAIASSYERLCLNPTHALPFLACRLPPLAQVEVALHCYWKYFDPVLPFLHPELTSHSEGCTLVVAMCAIGNRFMQAPTQYIASWDEFLRRSLHDSDDAAPILAQATLLHCVIEMYKDVPWSRPENELNVPQLVTIFDEAKSAYEGCHETESEHEQTRASWLNREQYVRLAYGAWLLDAMFACHYHRAPRLSLEHATLPLPSSEAVWHSKDESEWHEEEPLIPPPSLSVALQELYIDKKFPQDRGEFARVIAIYGLYQHLWTVSRYCENPLLTWNPVAKPQASLEVLPKQPIWLPSIPAFARWQNSTCDALDVLHWQANATIGRASGLEHPTVLHLHFARVVMLAPCFNLVRLARYMCGGYGIDKATSEQDTNQIRRWAVQHQYKARLAAIHAGVVFWHVRKYSHDAFYEAPSVALASLLLWAFGTYASKSPSSTTTARSSSQPTSPEPSLHTDESPDHAQEAQGDPVCSIILLDRPTDDELVQQFIKRGHEMQAHMTGVGNLYDDEGPQRVLSQATKLLSTLACWGVSTRWLQFIQKFSEKAKHRAGE